MYWELREIEKVFVENEELKSICKNSLNRTQKKETKILLMNKRNFWDAVLSDDCNTVLVCFDEVEDEDVIEALKVSALSEHHAFVYKKSDKLYDNDSSIIDHKKVFLLIDFSIIRIILEGSEIRGYWDDDIIIFFTKLIHYCAQYGFDAIDLSHYKTAKEEPILRKSNRRILFWASNIPPFANGTSIHALGALEGLWKNRMNLPPIDVCMNKKSAEIYRIYEKYQFDVFEQDEIEDVYELVYLPWTTYNSNVLNFIDTHAYKWCAWVLDVIGLRIFRDYMSMQRSKIFYEFVDGLIFSSQESRDDYSSLIRDKEKLNSIVVSLPANRNIEGNSVCEKNNLPFANYILIIGNTYKHKMIEETIEYVKETKDNYIVVGAKETGLIKENIYGYVSGTLSDSFVSLLYDKAEIVVFPSVYEGYGLPIIEALNAGKETVLVDRSLNRELELLESSFKGHMHYYKSRKQMLEKIIEAKESAGTLDKNTYKRNWADVGDDIAPFIKSVYDTPVDAVRLNERRLYFAMYSERDTKKYEIIKEIYMKDFTHINNSNVIDIYGMGDITEMIINKLQDVCKLGVVIDRNVSGKTKLCGVDVVHRDDYRFDEGHKVVIVPIHDYKSIKESLVERDNRIKDSVVTVTDFIRQL